MDMFQLPLIFLLFATCSIEAASVKTTPSSIVGTSIMTNMTNQVDLETSRKGQSSSTLIRNQRECTIPDLNKLKARISIAMELQVEKMLKDDYVDTHKESPSCTRYQGLTMSYPIRLFIRTTVDNAVMDYKLELLRP